MPLFTVEECHPSIQTGEFTELLRDLRAHELDLLVGESEPIEADRPDIELAVIHRPVLVAVVRPEVEPREDWQNLSGTGARLATIAKSTFLPKTMGALDDAFLMLDAVARGGFVAFVPNSVARPAVELGRVRVLRRFQPASAGVHALYRETDTANLARKAVEKLVENAKQQFEGE